MNKFERISQSELVNLNGTYCVLDDITAFKSQQMETINGEVLPHTVILLNSSKEYFIEDKDNRILDFLIEIKSPKNIVERTKK